MPERPPPRNKGRRPSNSPDGPATRHDPAQRTKRGPPSGARPAGAPQWDEDLPPPRDPHARLRRNVDEHLGLSPVAREPPTGVDPVNQEKQHLRVRRPAPLASSTSHSAHVYAPSRPVLVIGGGRLGRALLRRFPNTVVLETDPAKIPRLRKEFGAYRVYHGSGARREHLGMAGLEQAQAVVATTDGDETNYKAVSLARQKGIKQVIARVDQAEHAPRYKKIGVTPIAGPLPVVVNMIATLLSPERRAIGQGIIASNAPTDNVPIRDLRLPADAIIVSILRGESLVTPDGNERLRAGDIVTVMAEKDKLNETLIQITGRDLAMNPLNRLYVPLLSTGALRAVFREAYLLAQFAGAELFVFAPEDLAEVALEAERLATQSDIPFQMRLFPRKGFFSQVVEEIQHQDRKKDHGGLSDHLFFECVVIEPDRSARLNRWLNRRPLDRFLGRLDHPVLVARNQKRYQKILLVIDNTHRASMTVHHTVDLALVYSSSITALLPESAAGDAAYRLLRHLKRAGKLYGVEVEERFVRGNPTLEFVMEVKSGDYDLIVVDWQGRSVKRDILRRVIEYGPRSTLVLP